MNCIVHKWSDAENAELMRMHEKGVKNNKLAIVFKTTPGNISWRIRELKKKAVQEKPKERTIVDLIDEDFSSIDTGETYDDINRIITEEFATTAANAKIAKLCDVPDPPKPKLDYTESLLETLREEIEFREPVYFICEPEQQAPQPPPVKQYTIFDQAHDIITLLRHNAEDQEINISNIALTITPFIVDVSASNADGERVGWHEKYQPVSGNSTD